MNCPDLFALPRIVTALRLVLLAAGGMDPESIAAGHRAVSELVTQMDAGRRTRLKQLGFGDAQAAQLSALHTRNFM